ncbi:MAG: hypothetical protein A3A98_01890 [Candidatus Staskawiczbacteria bacterium RIFCSPLOWO2_01_FULL_40_39]|uniref:Amidohydrolase-related domain-containing protein n=1 Tax=Candidatus Staskawiczbacteria bacterium RIFCSPHIGHO2_01_FULL_39_25 TaxID=1802202 RepID=A0A1G2HQB1_9BACT|nr:MAG: hypothetical protein A2730_02045 [Candidatus Staskawiczbacteria bacterium RIFCSPHIGHO2_01_FULL_39_25]OGZ72722.1 MAG: hypothetical protein A3A98_01890 [Candidatus Staskawiczbacteria bacterium RIFCSPLOWO2_01_FULL_40_39]
MNQPIQKNQGEKGFLPIILIVIIGVAVIAAGGGFWYYQQSANQSADQSEVSAPDEQSQQAGKEEQSEKTEVSKPAEKAAVQKEAPKTAAEQLSQTSSATPTPAPKPSTCDLIPRPKKFNKTPYYTGQLFDAHFHVPNLSEVSLNKLLCIFDKEKVKGTILFYWNSQLSLEKRLAEAESIKNASLQKIRMFLSPVQYNLKALEDIEAAHKGLFTGYGEMAFYNRGDPSQSYYPKRPDEQQFLDIYALAEKNNFVVMIHPDRGQEQAIENILKKYPNVKFYFHGDEIENVIIGLMDRYPNVYYSIDAVLSRLPFPPADALHISSSENDYVTKITQNFSAILDGAVNEWKAKIEKHPDRFTWGTDRGGFAWHYGEEVSRLFEELSRSFIGRLDPSVQEKYAYKNAESLLQK